MYLKFEMLLHQTYKKVYIQNWEKAVKIFNPSERDADGYRSDEFVQSMR